MKILCLIDSLGSGGAERQMSYLSSLLVDKGHKVQLVIFSHGNDFYYDFVTERGVKVCEASYGVNKFKRPFEIISFVKRFKPDYVIAYKDGVTMAACIARMFCKFKLIVSERNTTQVLSRYERLKFNLYRFADFIIPNSFSQRDFINKTYPNLSHKVHVITNALDTELFKPSVTKSANDMPVVVTTARVMEQKNTIRYLEALAILKQQGIKAHFKWIGNQNSAYFKTVEEKRDALGLQDYIEFIPAQKNVVPFYQMSDFFCLPSTYEGFPNVLCEAMACGLPVTCGNVCDNPNIVKDGENGYLFNPQNVNSIADNLIRILNLRDNEKHRISCNNRKKICDLCSMNEFVDKYLALK